MTTHSSAALQRAESSHNTTAKANIHQLDASLEKSSLEAKVRDFTTGSHSRKLLSDHIIHYGGFFGATDIDGKHSETYIHVHTRIQQN